jgi:hypothetical protein
MLTNRRQLNSSTIKNKRFRCVETDVYNILNEESNNKVYTVYAHLKICMCICMSVCVCVYKMTIYVKI